MAYIWQNPGWPEFFYDKKKVEEACDDYQTAKDRTEFAFEIAGADVMNRFYVKSISDEIVSSLQIEGEKIDYESVLSSVAKRLDIALEIKASDDVYADSVSELLLDALNNKSPLTKERLDSWNRKILSKLGGSRMETCSYRTGPEYVVRNRGLESDVIYTAVPPERVSEEMNVLLNYINTDDERNLMVKSAVSALNFVIIHPYKDGNGRISRALSDYILSMKDDTLSKTYSMSSIILSKRKEYYEEIKKISCQSESLDYTDWIVWNINIAKQAQIRAVEELKKVAHLTGMMKSLDPSVYNSREMYMLYRLSEGSFIGNVTTSKWSKLTKCSSAMAQRDISHLVKEGFLIPTGKKGSGTSYIFNDFT